MQVQVEVAQLEGNDFFVKVFGEQKRGGFVRLMEALSYLGLEIINVNMTSCISLVSYVFIVKVNNKPTFCNIVSFNHQLKLLAEFLV